jgi:hypothetical protein
MSLEEASSQIVDFLGKEEDPLLGVVNEWKANPGNQKKTCSIS